MLSLIITGGESGADLGAWRAAQAAGITTGGAMPMGYLTEDGPHPEYSELYGAHQLQSALYTHLTAANVLAADAALWFGYTNSRGAHATFTAAWRAQAEIPSRCVSSRRTLPQPPHPPH